MLLGILQHGEVIWVDGRSVVDVDGHVGCGHVHVHVHVHAHIGRGWVDGHVGHGDIVGGHVHAHSGAGVGHGLLGEGELTGPLLGRTRLGLVRVHCVLAPSGLAGAGTGWAGLGAGELLTFMERTRARDQR